MGLQIRYGTKIRVQSLASIYCVQSSDYPGKSTLELRADFFIEKFEMRESLSPNNFVLLNGEPLEFSSEIDFLSWSKEFIENLSFLKISKNEVGHISHSF